MNPVGNILSGLVDIETGSFTPELIDSITGKRENYTASLAQGHYIRIGKLVYISINISGISGLQTVEDASKRACIAGLPLGVAYQTAFAASTIYGLFTARDEVNNAITIASFGNGRKDLSFLRDHGGNSLSFSSNGKNGIVTVSGCYITNDVTPAGG